jgi:hypothetical protein
MPTAALHLRAHDRVIDVDLKSKEDRALTLFLPGSLRVNRFLLTSSENDCRRGSGAVRLRSQWRWFGLGRRRCQWRASGESSRKHTAKYFLHSYLVWHFCMDGRPLLARLQTTRDPTSTRKVCGDNCLADLLCVSSQGSHVPSVGYSRRGRAPSWRFFIRCCIWQLNGT